MGFLRDARLSVRFGEFVLMSSCHRELKLFIYFFSASVKSSSVKGNRDVEIEKDDWWEKLRPKCY